MRELDVEYLAVDEFEALRLCDLEGMDQQAAGRRMGVSRGTVQRLLKSGRTTLVRTLMENRALVIGGEAMEGNDMAGEGSGMAGKGEDLEEQGDEES